MFSEVGRQLVHIGAGAFALLLRWLTWRQAVLLAVLALAFNALVLPRLGRRLFRPGDLGAREPLVYSGIVLYPVAVLGLVLLFPSRLDIAAASWGILAAGDGAATLVGTHLRTRPLGWNSSKSIGGLVAFIAAGGAAGVALALWVAPAAGQAVTSWTFLAPVMAAIIAGFIETAPIRLNDNLTVPAAAALVLWCTTFVDPGTWLVSAASVPARTWMLAVVLNLAVAAAGWRLRTVTIAGAATGAVIGTLIFLGAGPAGWALLLATFGLAAAATRVGYHRKALAGIAEERGGRRGPGNAIANTGLAAWAALLSWGMADPSLARLALVAALVAAGSDTVASEVGKGWGRRTWSVTSLRRVPAGTSGALSVEGTLAGVAAALALASLAAAIGLTPLAAVAVVTAAATIAGLAEGLLGATCEASGLLDNDALNFINSAIGAGLALIAWEAR